MKNFANNENNKTSGNGEFIYCGTNIEEIKTHFKREFSDKSILTCEECGKSVKEYLFFDIPKYCPYCGLQIENFVG